MTVAKYGSNPTTGSLSNGSDEYFDVKVSGSRSFTSLAVTDCGLNGGDTLYWWTGSAYKPVSPAATPGPPGCLTFTASATSSPSLTALTGTIFAVASAVVPARPTAPTAKPGNTQVTVTWQAPTTGGSSITSYKVTSSPGTKFCTWSSGPLTCTVLGLSNGTKYTFTVTAHNSVGEQPRVGGFERRRPEEHTVDHDHDAPRGHRGYQVLEPGRRERRHFALQVVDLLGRAPRPQAQRDNRRHHGHTHAGSLDSPLHSDLHLRRH